VLTLEMTSAQSEFVCADNGYNAFVIYVHGEK